MKIAVCLSGHYRTHDITFINWCEKLYSKYDCDIFFHTWDVNGTRIGFQNDEVSVEDLTPLKYTADQLKEKFKFTDVIVENYKDLHETFLHVSAVVRERRKHIPELENRRAVHLYSMWYKALQCFELMENYANQNNVKYDIVIKSRPDLIVFDPTIQTTYQFEHLPPITLDELELDKVTIPLFNKSDELHDYFAVGTVDSMRKYHQLYNHMSYLLDNISLADFLNPHTLLYNYTELFDIPVKLVRNFITIQR